MKFNSKNLPKTKLQLEEFVREHGLRAYGKVEYRGKEIYLAETELEKATEQYPWGYYQTSWFVNKDDDKLDIGSWVEFEAMHDMDEGWTQETKRQARLQTAVKNAQGYIDACIEVGKFH